MNLGDDFTDLVERHHDLDIAAIGRRGPARHADYELIWRGVGYVMVGRTPALKGVRRAREPVMRFTTFIARNLLRRGVRTA